jgi:hypothetical protein
MGLRDKAKELADAAKVRHAESQAASEARKQDDQAAREAQKQAEVAAREAELERRRQLAEQYKSTCLLPLLRTTEGLPAGMTLFPDEFLIGTGRDWGWSSVGLVMMTHRAIVHRGRAAKHVESVYWSDVRDVVYRKPMVGHGSLTIETAGGHSITGLSAASNAQDVRDRMLQLMHWARSSRDDHAPPPAAKQTDVQVTTSSASRLRELAELRDAG